MKALLYLGPAAILGLLLTAIPLIVAVRFAMRPSPPRLELMRPVTLGAIFATLAGLCLGVANALVAINRHGVDDGRYVAEVFAEAVIPTFVSCSLLATAWLVVAIGMRRLGLPGGE